MSADSARSEGNVRSIEEFLQGVLDDVEAVDARLHAARDQLRARLRAYELSRDPRFRDRLADAEKRLADGDLPPLDKPDFLSRRLDSVKNE